MPVNLFEASDPLRVPGSQKRLPYSLTIVFCLFFIGRPFMEFAEPSVSLCDHCLISIKIKGKVAGTDRAPKRTWHGIGVDEVLYPFYFHSDDKREIDSTRNVVPHNAASVFNLSLLLKISPAPCARVHRQGVRSTTFQTKSLVPHLPCVRSVAKSPRRSLLFISAHGLSMPFSWRLLIFDFTGRLEEPWRNLAISML